MVDENDAVSSETDELANTETTETVEAKPADDAAQAEAKTDDAEQGDNPGDEADKADAKAEDDDKADDKPKPNRKSAKERISQLTTIRRDQEREIAALRAKLERTQKLERPDPSKYEDPDEYSSDLAAFKVRTSETGDIEASVKDVEQRSAQVAVEAFNERLMDFMPDAPDFEQVANNPLLLSKLTPTMAKEMLDSDYGPQVQYYLGKNPREAANIASMSPTQQIRAIGRLEAEVSRPVQKRVTQAPAPIKPVGGTSKPRMSYSPDMSMADYKKMREAGRKPY